MTLGTSRQVEGRIQPTLILEFSVKALFDLRCRGKNAGFKQFRLQSNEDGGRQKGFAAVGEIAFVTASAAGDGSGNLFRYGDSLAELIEKAVNDSDDINIPGVEFTTFSGILKQTDGQTGADISSSARSRLLQGVSLTGRKLSITTPPCQSAAGIQLNCQLNPLAQCCSPWWQVAGPAGSPPWSDNG